MAHHIDGPVRTMFRHCPAPPKQCRTVSCAAGYGGSFTLSPRFGNQCSASRTTQVIQRDPSNRSQFHLSFDWHSVGFVSDRPITLPFSCQIIRIDRNRTSLQLLIMNLEDEAGATENSGGLELVDCEGDPIVEPCEGMEFDSEDAAKIFYDEYARRVGFVMRVMSCRRSERDGKILARRLGCNKEGYCVSIRGKFGPVRKPRASTREGCKAMIHVKVDRSGKWVITKFVKEHNHPLVVSPREARQTMDEKDKKIQELTAELRNKKRLCAAYQEQLTAFVKIVEEHNDQLSKKVQSVVNNIRKYEPVDPGLMRRS